MRITGTEAREKFKAQPEKVVLLDVRTPGEYRQLRVKGSQNIDFYNGFDRQVEKLDKGKIYIVFCASGGRSQAAVGLMRSKGFEAYNAGSVGDMIQAGFEYERG
ncbi:MAG: rhodanese-like domain-containing protein [Bacteroidia bacterium]|nr:rhodanese-like domain-containing protein [Bacteroidia bacterium]MCX7763415.1 rhodanese-like domain-containing protein [Bacteroidia bacterium]MDW8057580.1 rhodanese-like domain-containing protein [Bacteroidia bacterium]